MADEVIGTGSVVGFLNNANRDGHYGYHNAQWDNERTRDIIREVTARGVAGELATEKTAAAVNLNVEKIGAANLNALRGVENQIRTDAINFFNLGLIEQTKNAAAAALAAQVTKAEILAAHAECCCEIKELIRAENGATRDLINSNTISDLQRQLASIPRGIPVTLPVGLPS